MSPSEEALLVAAIRQIAEALTRLVNIQQERFKREYPEPKERRAAEVIRPGDEKEKQYGDRATAEWIEETERALPQSRFGKRYEESRKSPEQPASPGRSTETVPTVKRP